MSEFKELMINDLNNSPVWTMLENNFDKYYGKKQESVNIPKKIHQIWLGGEFPDKYKRLRDTWIKENPDWDYRLWTDEDVENFKLENINQFINVNN